MIVREDRLHSPKIGQRSPHVTGAKNVKPTLEPDFNRENSVDLLNNVSRVFVVSSPEFDKVCLAEMGLSAHFKVDATLGQA